MQNLEVQKSRLRQLLEQYTTLQVQLSTQGKIVPSRLAHYQTSQYIFSEPIPGTGKEYKADILLDITYSMFEDKRLYHTIKAAKNLVKLFYGLIDFRITVFGYGFTTISVNELLSIKEEDFNIDFRDGRGHYLGDDKLIEAFDHYFPQKFVEMGDSAFVGEGSGTRMFNRTNYYYPIKNAISSLEGEKCGKFIVLITDGNETDSFNYLKKINGIETDGCDYSMLKSKLEADNITLLPIGIKSGITQFEDSQIRIEDADEVNSEVLKFLEKNV